MRQHRLFYFILVIFSIVIMSACSSPSTGAQPEQSNASLPEPPAEYAGKKLPANSDAASGAVTYQIYCASCHGEKGLGDGVAAASLNPAPQNLAKNQKSMSDAYLYWRIVEGGMMEPFKSAMPSWNGILSEAQIWDVVSFIRSLSG